MYRYHDTYLIIKLMNYVVSITRYYLTLTNKFSSELLCMLVKQQVVTVTYLNTNVKWYEGYSYEDVMTIGKQT